jgi:hypothetical protein
MRFHPDVYGRSHELLASAGKQNRWLSRHPSRLCSTRNRAILADESFRTDEVDELDQCRAYQCPNLIRADVWCPSVISEMKVSEGLLPSDALKSGRTSR